MQNCSTENLHSREAVSACWTCENLCRHRHASYPLLEQTLLRSLFVVLIETLALVETLGSKPVFVWCNVTLQNNSVSSCADAEVSLRGSGSGNRRTQVRQVSVWWLDGLTFQSCESAEVCRVRHMCVWELERWKSARECVPVYMKGSICPILLSMLASLRTNMFAHIAIIIGTKWECLECFVM